MVDGHAAERRYAEAMDQLLEISQVGWARCLYPRAIVRMMV